MVITRLPVRIIWAIRSVVDLRVGGGAGGRGRNCCSSAHGK